MEGSNKIKNLSTSAASDKKLPAFDYGLVASLESDHEEILFLYNKVMQTAEQRNFLMLPEMLENFSTHCTHHFNTEDEKLYGYLQSLAGKNSKIETRIFNEFYSDMKNISISIFCTVSQSSNIPVTDKTINGFIGEFKKLGEILKDRINREEKTLFPLYQKSRKVVDIS